MPLLADQHCIRSATRNQSFNGLFVFSKIVRVKCEERFHGPGVIATIPRQSRGLSDCEPLKAANGDADASPVYWAAWRRPVSAIG